jgi:hypothetical protein
VNITIPTIDDDSISLYECVGILGNKLQEAIQKINDSFGSLEGAYTAANPPPYPVTSVNLAETKDVITVYVPEGGGIEDAKQEDLIKACKAGARLGAFDLDNKTCRLYHLNLFVDPERVEYTEVAGGNASGVTSVNDQTGAVNIFNAPISAATAASVTALNNNKVAYADALTLEEIQASTDLTNKVAGAESVKLIKNQIGTITHGNFYTEQNKGNTMPATYGAFIRVNGNSWPGRYNGDTYYIGIDADSVVYAGAQLNGATQITWKTI